MRSRILNQSDFIVGRTFIVFIMSIHRGLLGQIISFTWIRAFIAWCHFTFRSMWCNNYCFLQYSSQSKQFLNLTLAHLIRTTVCFALIYLGIFWCSHPVLLMFRGVWSAHVGAEEPSPVPADTNSLFSPPQEEKICLCPSSWLSLPLFLRIHNLFRIHLTLSLLTGLWHSSAKQLPFVCTRSCFSLVLASIYVIWSRKSAGFI